MANVSTFEQDLTKAIREAVEHRIKQITEEEIAKAQAAIARRIKDDLARVVMAVHQEYEIEFGKRAIVIRVKLEQE